MTQYIQHVESPTLNQAPSRHHKVLHLIPHDQGEVEKSGTNAPIAMVILNRVFVAPQALNCKRQTSPAPTYGAKPDAHFELTVTDASA